jgi:hypothetical protein
LITLFNPTEIIFCKRDIWLSEADENRQLNSDSGAMVLNFSCGAPHIGHFLGAFLSFT